LTKSEKYSKQYLAAEIDAIETSQRKEEHPQLSVYEKALIYSYSEDGYETLNEHLRVSNGKNTTEFGKLLAKVLHKLPDFVGVVYRGVELTSGQLETYTDALVAAKPVIEPCFLSTSKSRLIGGGFGDNPLFIMYSRTGKLIEKIAKFGVYGPANEQEVLFAPNTRFNVLDITFDGIKPLITMEEIA
jgi:NAD:arginine ADP-ribosyltransferase